MQLILFDDRRHLTDAVREGLKTNTRRILKNQTGNLSGFVKYTRKGSNLIYVRADFDNGISEDCRYKIGEVVAVGRRYKAIENHLVEIGIQPDDDHKGWRNKLHVRADLMPLRIRILDIRPERLQDITEQDCLREFPECDTIIERHIDKVISMGASVVYNWITRRDVFAWLIDKISGKGTWEQNPFVWRIEFELIETF